jgi:hypothetical protein
MRQRIAWLIVPLCWALACGGRFEQTTDPDGDGGTSTGQGGSSQPKAGTSTIGKGGAASSGGTQTTSKGGGAAGSKATGTGGKATGGMTSTGGTFAIGGAAGTCTCDPLACPIGYVSLPNPDGCCFHCEKLNSCEAQREDYARFRTAIFEKYSFLNCQIDADCGLYFEKNACGVACPVAVINTALRELPNILDNYAAMKCSQACPPQPPIDCGPKVAPECWKGYCQ